jgi:hypothetical protein
MTEKREDQYDVICNAGIDITKIDKYGKFVEFFDKPWFNEANFKFKQSFYEFNIGTNVKNLDKNERINSLFNLMCHVDEIIEKDINKIIETDQLVISLKKILKTINEEIYSRSNVIRDEHLEKEKKKYNYEEITKAIDKLSE